MSLLSGGATGIIGVAVQRYFDMKNRQLDIQLEKEKRETSIAIAASKLKAVQEQQDGEAFTKSVWEETSRYVMPTQKLTRGQAWIMVTLDALRGCIRPLMTFYLCVLTTWIWWQVWAHFSYDALTLETQAELWKLVVTHILGLGTTVTLWWFGTRNRSKPIEVR